MSTWNFSLVLSLFQRESTCCEATSRRPTELAKEASPELAKAVGEANLRPEACRRLDFTPFQLFWAILVRIMLFYLANRVNIMSWKGGILQRIMRFGQQYETKTEMGQQIFENKINFSRPEFYGPRIMPIVKLISKNTAKAPRILR